MRIAFFFPLRKQDGKLPHLLPSEAKKKRSTMFKLFPKETLWTRSEFSHFKGHGVVWSCTCKTNYPFLLTTVVHMVITTKKVVIERVDVSTNTYTLILRKKGGRGFAP